METVRVKVFSVDCFAKDAGTKLTELIDKWVDSQSMGFVIVSTHTAANNAGMMVTITYRTS